MCRDTCTHSTWRHASGGQTDSVLRSRLSPCTERVAEAHHRHTHFTAMAHWHAPSLPMDHNRSDDRRTYRAPTGHRPQQGAIFQHAFVSQPSTTSFGRRRVVATPFPISPTTSQTGGSGEKPTFSASPIGTCRRHRSRARVRRPRVRRPEPARQASCRGGCSPQPRSVAARCVARVPRTA